MALTYVSTCAGGYHHTFVDEKGVRHVFTTDQLAEEQLTAVAVQKDAADKLVGMPDDVKAKVEVSK